MNSAPQDILLVRTKAAMAARKRKLTGRQPMRDAHLLAAATLSFSCRVSCLGVIPRETPKMVPTVETASPPRWKFSNASYVEHCPPPCPYVFKGVLSSQSLIKFVGYHPLIVSDSILASVKHKDLNKSAVSAAGPFLLFTDHSFYLFYCIKTN